jgi:hypothetical protein
VEGRDAAHGGHEVPADGRGSLEATTPAIPLSPLQQRTANLGTSSWVRIGGLY